MKEIVRLVDGDATAAQRLLLKAAQAHRPPDDQARAKTAAAAAALAAGSAALVVGSGKAVGAAAFSRMRSPALLKLCALLTLGGGVGVGAVLLVRHNSTLSGVETSPASTVPQPLLQTSRPAPPLAVPADPLATPPSAAGRSSVPASPLPAPPAVATGVAAIEAQPVSRSPISPQAGTAAPRLEPTSGSVSAAPIAHEAAGAGGSTGGSTTEGAPPTVAADPSLAPEIRLLDEARARLSAHDPRNAIAALDRYATAFPAGVFRPESRVLRIQALLDAGDRASATKLADELVRVDPNGPYAQRVRKMIGESK